MMNDILDEFRELNPSNYDHDDVCRLNKWAMEAYDELTRLREINPETKKRQTTKTDDTALIEHGAPPFELWVALAVVITALAGCFIDWMFRG